MKLLLSSTSQLTVFPLPGGGVDDAKQLVVGDGLGVEIDSHRLLLHVLVCLEQRLPDARLAGSRVTHNEHRVTHLEQLLQLHDLCKQLTVVINNTVCAYNSQ